MSFSPASKVSNPKDSQSSADLARVQEYAAKLVASADAPNTTRTYALANKIFAAWCSEWRHCESLPVSADAITEFIAWCSYMKTPPYKASTIQIILVAIKRAHKAAGVPFPADKRISATLSGVYRQEARQGSRPELAGKKYLQVDQLRRMCLAIKSDSPLDVRDRAILLLGFASALRRSDLASIEMSHISHEDGALRIWIPYSKTDQLGVGRTVRIAAAQDALMCAVKAVDAWMKIRADHVGNAGPLFIPCAHNRPAIAFLTGSAICSVVKRRIGAIGEDANDYGAHSMRSGMITAADAAGASLRTIMEHTGHRSIENVMRYIKPRQSANALSGVL